MFEWEQRKIEMSRKEEKKGMKELKEEVRAMKRCLEEVVVILRGRYRKVSYRCRRRKRRWKEDRGEQGKKRRARR